LLPGMFVMRRQAKASGLGLVRQYGDRSARFMLPSPLVGEGGEIERSEMEPDEGVCNRGDRPLTRLRCFASQPPSPTRGEGIFLILYFSYVISMLCRASKVENYARLHIDSKSNRHELVNCPELALSCGCLRSCPWSDRTKLDPSLRVVVTR
jgi:hypothetical protein